VQLRRTPCGGSSPALCTVNSVAINTRTSPRIELRPGLVFVNDVHRTEGLLTLGDGSVVMQLFRRTQVTLANGIVVTLWDSGSTDVRVPAALRGRACGLCGTFTGTPTDELRLGTDIVRPLALANGSASVATAAAAWEMAVSWVTPTSVQAFQIQQQACAVSTEDPPPDPCAGGPTDASLAACLPLVDLYGPYALGLGVVSADPYYAACLRDVCASGPTAACPAALRAYEDALMAAGVTSFASQQDRCGVCGGDGSSCAGDFPRCSTWSGKHFQSFSGALFDFSAKCRYVLSADDRSTFSVLVGHSDYWFATVLINRELALDLDVTGRVWVRGVPLVDALVTTLADGTQIWGEPGTTAQRIYFPAFGLTLYWDGAQALDVELPSAANGTTVGLCGSLGGSGANDLAAFGSTRLYGLHWAVPAGGGMHPNEPVCVDPLSPPPPPPACSGAVAAANAAYCAVLNISAAGTSPYRACFAVVNPAPYLASCVADTCASGAAGGCVGHCGTCSARCCCNFSRAFRCSSSGA
jgi:hypothetical protein